MISTPIYDFVNKYTRENNVRCHMPGHKGKGALGCEEYDITEICGADSLFEAEGIIAESERNLSEIFGTRASFYSTEGSSLCIRAMVFLAKLYSGGKGKILAGRNAHKSFLSALALCDVDADWIYGDSLYSCSIDAKTLENELKKGDYFAFYVTSPDYLGSMADIQSLADVCHRYGVVLIVDNAHGAYLKFVGNHPMDCGADMCCDSAHKTLPCLTGAAYLHVSKSAMFPFEADAKRAMSLFASTSPSYLIMTSMDLANKTMADNYGQRVRETASRVDELKTELSHLGIDFTSREKLKINIMPKSFGYFADELAKMLEDCGIHPEFCDRDNLVLMFSTDNGEKDFLRLTEFFRRLEPKKPIPDTPPRLPRLNVAMSKRDAMFAKTERVSVKDAVGRILASPGVACPPAIPIAVCGEVIDEEAALCFEYYGVDEIEVVE